MLTENGQEVDLEALGDVLRRADVITVGFTTFPERLFVDTRGTAAEGPLVAIVDPVGTVQERYLWLGRHRPSFGAPEGFSFFVWPQTVRGLVERDVLRPLRDRLAEASETADRDLGTALERLLELEQGAIRQAIMGDAPWQTVWSRTG